jgi:L-cystine uptake protein TcyP (sodium:dicarboxylate symporter family)
MCGALIFSATALILEFMLGSNVLSPKYMIWLISLAPLSAEGTTGLGVSVVFLTACWITTLVFPIDYSDLVNLRLPGPSLLLARNLLLLHGSLLLLMRRNTLEQNTQ